MWFHWCSSISPSLHTSPFGGLRRSTFSFSGLERPGVGGSRLERTEKHQCSVLVNTFMKKPYSYIFESKTYLGGGCFPNLCYFNILPLHVHTFISHESLDCIKCCSPRCYYIQGLFSFIWGFHLLLIQVRPQLPWIRVQSITCPRD